MSKTVIIIPSRLSAKRLPNKPLLKINGKSIISLVYLKAVACKIGRVIVATEDKKISDEIKKYNGNVILTSKKHQLQHAILNQLLKLEKTSSIYRKNIP